MAQRGNRAERAVQARQIVAQISCASRRRAVGRSVERHETQFGLGQSIVTDAVRRRTELAEPADRHINDVSFDLAAMLVADTPLVEGAWTEILDDDIRARCELKKNLASLIAAQIQRETAFV